MLLHEVVEFAAVRTPDTTALVFEDRSWTFAELWADIEVAAGWLAERTDPGDRIAIVSDNRPEVVVLMYAAPMVGVVAMFANTRLVESEIADLIADVSPVLELRSDELGELSAVQNVGRERIATDDRATAWIIHTSGTTGRPKGAMLTHRSLMAGVMATALARPVGPDDTYLFPFPLFHVASYGVVHLHFRGRPVVLVPKFDAVPVMAAIERHRVTTISLAPTMIAMLLDHPERASFDLSSLRHVFYGASAIPRDVLQRGLAEFGCGFGQGYGMTELSGNAVFLDAEAHRRAAVDEPHLLSSCGKVGPLAAIRLADDGEILIRGDQVVPGYWDRPEANEAAFVDGWFRTGDIGRFDDEGYLYIVDRSKDIIVSGGENVASLEVEDVLSEHPDLAAVAVVGVPDERWGERVVLVAVARPGTDPSADGVMAWARGRLAGFKRPRQVLFVDELPTNASGKVLKREVRNLAAERLR
ncbi:MAG: AMP-binding protein [Microthrixaceae bacterium]|nr:AMP-binding protein [Microthrixaceae bacterium]